MATLRSSFKRAILGLEIPDEYVCAPFRDLTPFLQVMLSIKDESFNVTGSHILLGYKPLILGIYFEGPGSSTLPAAAEISLELRTDERVEATLDLKRIRTLELHGISLHCFEGVRGQHTFINSFHQRVNRLRERVKQRPQGNVSLSANLYDQVRIAYAVPRLISVISVGKGEQFNMFPTDLHGPVGSQGYIGSLRSEGKASDQVEETRNIVISTIEPARFRAVYAMGRNHMRDMKPLEHFETNGTLSSVFRLPLPRGAVGYKELRLRESIDHGIHRLHVFDVVHEQPAGDSDVLSHVHHYYAQWRNNHGLVTPWLLR